MITSIELWLLSHPLESIILSLILAPPIYYLEQSLVSLFKVQPQRLNIWILKARLQNLETKLGRIYNIRDDSRHLILGGFMSLMFLLCALALISLPLILMVFRILLETLGNHDTHSPTVSFYGSLFLGAEFSCTICGIISFTLISEMLSAVLHSDQAIDKLRSKIEKLKAKLESKTGWTSSLLAKPRHSKKPTHGGYSE